MSFTVQSSGTQWATFALTTDFSLGACSGTLETTINGPGSITGGQFNWTGSHFAFAGTFDTPVSAHGTYAYTGQVIGSGCSTLTQAGTWSATTVGDPPGGLREGGAGG